MGEGCCRRCKGAVSGRVTHDAATERAPGCPCRTMPFRPLRLHTFPPARSALRVQAHWRFIPLTAPVQLHEPRFSYHRFVVPYARLSISSSRSYITKTCAALVAAIGLFPIVGCNRSEWYTRDMTWSSESPVGLRRLPEGAVRLTFVQSPSTSVGLQIPGLRERLESSGKRIVPVQFEIQCSHRTFALIKVRAVDGHAVQTTGSNMWTEIASVNSPAPGPFPGACWY